MQNLRHKVTMYLGYRKTIIVDMQGDLEDIVKYCDMEVEHKRIRKYRIQNGENNTQKFARLIDPAFRNEIFSLWGKDTLAGTAQRARQIRGVHSSQYAREEPFHILKEMENLRNTPNTVYKHRQLEQFRIKIQGINYIRSLIKKGIFCI